MRTIDADALKRRVQEIWDTGDYWVPDVLNVIDSTPTIEAIDTDAETRGYVHGYNDAVQMTFKLMLQYGSDREEEEHER